MLTSYKHHDVSLGHYLKLTEICTEFNRLQIRAKMFKHLNENEEQYFSDSCVSARTHNCPNSTQMSYQTQLILIVYPNTTSISYCLCLDQTSGYDSPTLSQWDRVARRFLSHLLFCFSELQIRNIIKIIKNAGAIQTLQCLFDSAVL